MRTTTINAIGKNRMPKMQHGARPVPLLVYHLANCGRNCGVRRGKPIPAALPKIEEDTIGEAREEILWEATKYARSKPRVIKFSDSLPTREEPSLKFQEAMSNPAMLHSPPTQLLPEDEQELILWYNESEDDDVKPGDAGSLHASDSTLLKIFMHKPVGDGHEPVECRDSLSPKLDTIPEGVERQYVAAVCKKHKERCGHKCGRRKGYRLPLEPAFLDALMEDVKGEEAASIDSPSPTVIDDSLPPLSLAESKESNYSTRKLIGLGFFNIPELTYSMSTMSSESTESQTKLSTLEWTKATYAYYNLPLDGKSQSWRLTRKGRTQMIVEDVGSWVRRRIGRVAMVGA